MADESQLEIAQPNCAKLSAAIAAATAQFTWEERLDAIDFLEALAERFNRAANKLDSA